MMPFKKISQAIIILVVILILRPHVGTFLSWFSLSDFKVDKVSTCITSGIVIFIFLYLSWKEKILTAFNITKPFYMVNAHAMLWPLFLFAPAFAVIYQNLLIAHPSDVLVFLSATIILSTAEEVVFRIFVFGILVKYTGKIMLPIVVSSILFGLMHYGNFFSGQMSIEFANGQVIYATFIGIYLCGVFLRTQNVYTVFLIHSIVNIVGMQNKLKESYLPEELIPTFEASPENEISSYIILFVIFPTIALFGILMARWADTEKFKEKLGLTTG
ncbi:MAG: CPBP family intramembrane glutamic endopeptidase [Luteibaculaceae bacterium]